MYHSHSSASPHLKTSDFTYIHNSSLTQRRLFLEYAPDKIPVTPASKLHGRLYCGFPHWPFRRCHNPRLVTKAVPTFNKQDAARCHAACLVPGLSGLSYHSRLPIELTLRFLLPNTQDARFHTLILPKWAHWSGHLEAREWERVWVSCQWTPHGDCATLAQARVPKLHQFQCHVLGHEYNAWIVSQVIRAEQPSGARTLRQKYALSRCG